MYDVNSIIARLQNGESADAIANEMAAAMNEALAQVQKAKEDEARKAARKDAIIQKMGKLMLEYMTIEVPEFVDSVDEEDAIAMMADAMEGTVAGLRTAAHVIQEVENCGTKVKEVLDNIDMPAAKAKIEVSGDKAANEIAKFLRSLGL